MKTLIILHGWQSSKEKWQKVKENLESQELKVIVPDLPGFKPETALKKPWSLNGYVNWLKELTVSRTLVNGKANGVQDSGFFLLGHSFGGRVAIKFASKYSEMLKGLILVSAAGIKKKKTLYERILFRLIRLVKKIGTRKTIRTNKVWEICRKIFYRYILRKTDYYRADAIQKGTMKMALEEDLKPFLDKISVPTLIIWGKKDKITLLKDAFLMKERIKNSQLQVLENIGHTPHLENPELLAEKIKEFIK